MSRRFGLSRSQVVKLLEATELLHAHLEGSFEVRLFRATQLVYEDTFHGFEVFDLETGTHTISSDMPWPEARRAELMAISAEVVPKEHPIFPLLAAGHAEPMQLSDLLSAQRLETTVLYNEIFRPAHTRYQIAIPFSDGRYVGGLTINRGGHDYSERDLEMAREFSRHVLLAYRTGSVLSKARGVALRVGTEDYTELRSRGLTRRECDVMVWVREGKRNAEVAMILGMSTRTVEAHVAAVFRKLGVDTRTGAILALFR